VQTNYLLSKLQAEKGLQISIDLKKTNSCNVKNMFDL